ncbi:hypothetical protein PYCC9005_005192 [Savitreella phatthalungensis]
MSIDGHIVTILQSDSHGLRCNGHWEIAIDLFSLAEEKPSEGRALWYVGHPLVWVVFLQLLLENVAEGDENDCLDRLEAMARFQASFSTRLLDIRVF